MSNYITEYRKERGITREEKAKSEKLVCDYTPAQIKNMPPRDKKAVVLGLVIFYGNVPEECKGNIIRVKAFQEKFSEAKRDGW